MVRLKPFDFAQAAAKAGMRVDGMAAPRLGALAPAKVEKSAESPSFATAIDQALRSVSRTQHDATRMQREVQLDNPTVSLEETMVAMQRAQIGFQAAVQVRNRLVSAYTEIMNMQV